MGAGNVLPVIPVFIDETAPSMNDLNNLAYAASFVIDHGTRPTWKFIEATTSQSITANTWTVVPFNTVIYDSDGVWTSGSHGAVIVTQGYYKLEASVQTQISNTRDNFVTAFKWTAGASSPYSASSPAWFGYKAIGTSLTGSAAATNSNCISDTTPFAMYPGDTLQAMVYLTGTHIIEINDNAGYMQARFSMQFTGRWVREGS